MARGWEGSGQLWRMTGSGEAGGWGHRLHPGVFGVIRQTVLQSKAGEREKQSRVTPNSKCLLPVCDVAIHTMADWKYLEEGGP